MRTSFGTVPKFSATTPTVRVLAGTKTWVAPEAMQQLKTVAQLPGVVAAVGMPDLHPSRGIPNGVALATTGRLYPHLIGNDIGCGMSLFALPKKARDMKLDKLEKKLSGLETPWEGDRSEWLKHYQAQSTPCDTSLGTIGGGNHFAELQKIETVDAPDTLAQLGLNPQQAFLLIHSGSRGYGQSLLTEVLSKGGVAGLSDNSPEAQEYLHKHDNAVRWASANRALIAHRFQEQLGSGDVQPVIDSSHNKLVQTTLEEGNSVWLHRKGASPADEGLTVIPGSRGALSFLVEPLGNGIENLKSLAHGAGRKVARGQAKDRLKDNLESLKRTALGSRVICEDKKLLAEEAPEMYKDIHRVIEDLVSQNLIRVVASFRPLLTYKLRHHDPNDFDD